MLRMIIRSSEASLPANAWVSGILEGFRERTTCEGLLEVRGLDGD